MANSTNIGLMLGSILSGATNQQGRQRGYLDGMRGIEAGSTVELNNARIGEVNADTDIKKQRLQYMTPEAIERQSRRSMGYDVGQEIPVDKMADIYKSQAGLEQALGSENKSFDLGKYIQNVQRNKLTENITPENALEVATGVSAIDGKMLDILKGQMINGIAKDGKPNGNERGLLYSQGKGEYGNLGSDGTFNQVTGASTINPAAIKQGSAKASVVDKERGLMINPDGSTSYIRNPDGTPIKTKAELKVQPVLNQGALDSIDTAMKSLETIISHPGREAATGTSAIFNDYALPGTDRAGFKARLETFKAQTFVPMVAQLKGMGALSDAEGKKLTAAVGALDPTMPEAEFIASANEIMKELELKRKRALGDNTSKVGDSKTYTETRTLPDGRRIGKTADGKIEIIQ